MDIDSGDYTALNEASNAPSPSAFRDISWVERLQSRARNV